LGGVRLGQTLTGALYFLLLVSAFLALWTRRFPGRLPGFLEQASPWVFLVFLAVFAFYRLGLMRAGRYPVFKGFFQIALGLFVFTLLLPGARRVYEPPAVGELSWAFNDANPKVRALAAEVAGYRRHGRRYAPELVKALEDPDPMVREEAHRSLVRFAGQDLGPPKDKAAIQRWRERFP
jgi:hypothetical protein